jgi:hypothetical protein
MYHTSIIRNVILNRYEKFLANLQLEPDLFRIKTVEMDLRGILNPINELDNLFFKKEKWLGFQDFFTFYLERYDKELKIECKDNNWEDFTKGLKARLYRTQFGFLTEYHAFLIAKLLFGDEKVNRSVTLDKKGVDFQIFYNKEIYNIHIFVDTERAWYFRKIKSKYKNVEQEEGIHVNLPYSLQKDNIHSVKFLPNGFGIFRKDYFEYLKSQIDLGKIKNNNISSVGKNEFTYKE